MTAKTDAEVLEILRRPFEAFQIKQKGRFSYIGHAFVTQRLTEADPYWETEIVDTHTYHDANSVMHCAGMTISLTIHFPEYGPVTRIESGGPQRMESFALEVKNAASDALKRAAMRFGVALDMWESLIDAEGDEDYHPSLKRMPQRSEVNGQPNPPTSVSAGLTAEQAAAITRLGAEIDDNAWVNTLLTKQGAAGIDALSRRGASSVITAMQQRITEQRKQRATVS